MGAVKDPGCRQANIILPLAAFLPLCMERNQGQMPPLLAHILSAASQDWGSRAWLCTLKPVARRPESLGTQIMVLFKLLVHLHPGWTGGLGTRVAGFLSASTPAQPHLAQLTEHLTLHLGCSLPLRGLGEIPGVSQFSYLENGDDNSCNDLILLGQKEEGLEVRDSGAPIVFGGRLREPWKNIKEVSLEIPGRPVFLHPPWLLGAPYPTKSLGLGCGLGAGTLQLSVRGWGGEPTLDPQPPSPSLLGFSP